jgi:hypothetical protein
VTIEGCRLWLQPLPSAENGFAAGVVPGENAVDTKAALDLPRARLVIRDTVAYGFQNGLIGNMAAFNLKENIDATVDRVTVYDSEIAFRLRGAGVDRAGALVGIRNAVVHSTATAYRYEDEIDNLRIWNSTVGSGVTQVFRAASATATGMDVRNLLVLSSSLPAEASHPSNLATGAESFTKAAAHNYTLVKGAPAIDAGASIAEVTADRQGTARPQGSAWDVGAYEYPQGAPTPPSETDGEIVLHATSASAIAGAWTFVPDPTAAGGVRLHHPDLGERAKKKPLALPTDFFEITFQAEAGRPYRLWIRGQAQNNSASNDAVFVQFSGSLSESGTPAYRIGTTFATGVTLADCKRCPLNGWGWQDNGEGPNTLGPVIYFAATGMQTIRVQTREDGFSIDQIVLSATHYLIQSPGTLTGDVVILPEARGF